MLNNSNSSIYNGIFVNTNGHAITNGVTNGNCSNGTYAKPYVNGNVIGTNGTNGVNSHDEEEPYINKTAKNLNLADVLKNGLFSPNTLISFFFCTASSCYLLNRLQLEYLFTNFKQRIYF